MCENAVANLQSWKKQRRTAVWIFLTACAALYFGPSLLALIWATNGVGTAVAVVLLRQDGRSRVGAGGKYGAYPLACAGSAGSPIQARERAYESGRDSARWALAPAPERPSRGREYAAASLMQGCPPRGW